jgi:hypothetical protein
MPFPTRVVTMFLAISRSAREMFVGADIKIGSVEEFKQLLTVCMFMTPSTTPTFMCMNPEELSQLVEAAASLFSSSGCEVSTEFYRALVLWATHPLTHHLLHGGEAFSRIKKFSDLLAKLHNLQTLKVGHATLDATLRFIDSLPDLNSSHRMSIERALRLNLGQNREA